CSNYLSGDLTKSSRAIDGIIGLRWRCIGSWRHYNLNLLSIAVSDQIVPINPAVFAASSSGSRGTIVDSGTTLVYLAEEAYDPFETNAVSLFTHPTPAEDAEYSVCFPISSSVDEIFPPVTLYFEGDAPMVLKPRDYLLQRHYSDGGAEWCLGFQKGQGLTILGDLVLKDKIIIYDLARQRLGWVNYNCSSRVNVSSTQLVSISKDLTDLGFLQCIPFYTPSSTLPLVPSLLRYARPRSSSSHWF
ncbi:hypothetical protein MKX01_027292, partial [Papaver californicum]